MSAVGSCVCNIADLPDVVLLHILQYLDHIDLSYFRNVNSRFRSICMDRELVRHVSFTRCHKLTDKIFQAYVRPIAQQIESLNLSYCYWLTSRCYDVISRCSNLVSINLLQCIITPKRLCTLLAGLTNLQFLAFSVRDMRDLHTELANSLNAQKTLHGLRSITLHFRNHLEYGAQNMSMHFVARPSIFDYCRNLEEFHVLGFRSNCKGIPLYILQPQISKLENLKNMRCMSISDAIDPVARMFFFAVLLEVCKLPDIHFQTLLQPMAALEHLQNKPHFVKCLQSIQQLQHLDISRTVQHIPNKVFNLNQAFSLRYLNMADNTEVDSQSLHVLADNCRHLVSINLRNCHSLLIKTLQDSADSESQSVDASGLQSLLLNCIQLRHINVSGIHIHAEDLMYTGFSSICDMLALNTNWKSIALSPCCLCARQVEEILTTTKATGGKRVLVTYSQDQGTKRRRIGVEPLNLDISQEKELSSELGKLVHACPDVQHFELIGAGFRSACNKNHGMQSRTFSFTSCAYASIVGEEDLLCIRHWKNLRSLQLSGIPGIRGGECLAAIANNCVRLERYFISHLGLSAQCQYRMGLLKALPLAKCLKDFRLEQPGLQLNHVFWTALGKSSRVLERVCIIAKNGTFENEAVMHFVKNIQTLNVLHMFTGNTLCSCRSLQTYLAQTHLRERPALSLCIFPLQHEDLPQAAACIPDVHLDELTILDSNICLQPPGWDKVLGNP